MKWWEESSPMLINAVSGGTIEEKFRILYEHTIPRGFDAEQQSFNISFFNREPTVKDYEDFKRYLNEAHSHNIKEIVYINTHCFGEDVYKDHPEWACVRRDGTPPRIYTTAYYVCLNSTWKAYILNRVKKLVEYDVDGIFYDGPLMVKNVCFCVKCQEKYREQTGKDLFKAADEAHIAFNTQVVIDFMRDTQEIIRSVSSNVLLYGNKTVLHPNVTGATTRNVEPYSDILGTEGGFIWLTKATRLWYLSPMAKMLETQSRGKPKVIFTAGDHKPWSHFAHTAEETKILYYQSAAYDASIWYTMHGGEHMMSTPGGQTAVDCNRFIRKYREKYNGTESPARVALMWSQPTADFYVSSTEQTDFYAAGQHGIKDGVKSNHTDAFYGFYEILTRAHIQFDVIDEVSISEGALKNYDSLLLPTCACMSDETAESIRTFTATGGTLVSNYDTGFYCADGKPARRPKIADVQGFTEVRRYVTYPNEGTGFMRAAGDHAITAGQSCPLIPSTDIAVDVVPAAGSVVAAEFLDPMPGEYSPLSETSYCAVLLNDFGKGKSVYFTGAFGEFYKKATLPDYARMLVKAVGADPLVISDAPETIEIILRRKGERYFLHLINLTGEMTRPIKRILPIPEVYVEVSLGRPAQSTVAVTDTKVRFMSTENGCKLIISPVDDYVLVEIQ